MTPYTLIPTHAQLRTVQQEPFSKAESRRDKQLRYVKLGAAHRERVAQSMVLAGPTIHRAIDLISGDGSDSSGWKQPVYFVAHDLRRRWPELDGPESSVRLDSVPPERLHLIENIWIVSTYLRLKAKGMNVRIEDHLIPDSINVCTSDRLIQSPGSHRAFIVAVQADRPSLGWGDYTLVQSPVQASRRNTCLIDHWPQPGLVPRDCSRDNCIRRMAYMGYLGNLAPGFRRESFRKEMRALGVEWVVRDQPADWRNFGDLDLCLAVRYGARAWIRTKPATKLAHSWLAGCPALLGNEPAFRYWGKPGEDYFEVAEPADAVEVVRRLVNEPALYQQVRERGLAKGREHDEEAVCRQWIAVLAGPIVEQFRSWRTDRRHVVMARAARRSIERVTVPMRRRAFYAWAKGSERLADFRQARETRLGSGQPGKAGRLVRSRIDKLCAATGVLRWLESRAAGTVNVLMYHRVLPIEQCESYPLSNLVVPEPLFAEQVEWLRRSCTTMTVGEAVAELTAGSLGSERIVCLSFDDGYRDNYEVASPILDAAGIRATFFVTAGLIGTEQVLWFDQAILCWQRRCGTRPWLQAHEALLEAEDLQGKCASLDGWLGWLKGLTAADRGALLDRLSQGPNGPCDDSSYQLMSVNQVVDLQRRGHEIGSHTMTHPILTTLDANTARQELEQSRLVLEGWLGQRVGGFCYPNGSHDDRVCEAVRAAGYAYACTTARGANRVGADPLRLTRRAIFPASYFSCDRKRIAASFRAEVFGLHDWQRGLMKLLHRRR